MGIFSLPAEPTRCSDSLFWFAPPPWSPLRLATLFLATLVLATLVLMPQQPTTAPSTLLTPLQLVLTTLVLVLATMPGPSPAGAGPPVLLEANPPWAIPSPPPSPREAEAEPYLGYAGLGYAGLGYAGLGYAGLGYGYAGAYGYGKSAPCVNAANFPVPCRG